MNYKGTISPFLFTLLYVIIIVIYNIVFFYIIISIMLSEKAVDVYPPIVLEGASTINNLFFKPVIDYINNYI